MRAAIKAVARVSHGGILLYLRGAIIGSRSSDHGCCYCSGSGSGSSFYVKDQDLVLTLPLILKQLKTDVNKFQRVCERSLIYNNGF